MIHPRGHLETNRPPAMSERRRLALSLHASLCLLSIVLCWVASNVFLSPAWSWFALINFVWMIILLLTASPRAAILIVPIAVQKLSIIISLILIEYGNEMPELGTVGRPGPYSNAFVFYTAVFVFGYLGAYYLLMGRRNRPLSHPLTPLFERHANFLAFSVLALVGLLTLYLTARGIISGFPLLQGTDRFVYRRYSDTLTVYILNFKFVIAFLLGVTVFATPASRPMKLVCGLNGLYLLLLYFLFADKFFTQLNAIAAFFSPYIYRNAQTIWRDMYKYSVVGVLALGLVSMVTWGIYSDFGARTTAESSKKLAGRLTGQGELWFLQASIGSPLIAFDKGIVSENINALFVKEIDLYAVQHSLGPNYFSNKYAPDDIRSSIMTNAGTTTYTAALEPLGLVAFGWIGLGVMLVLCGGVVGFYASYMAYAIETRSVMSAIFSGYLFLQLQAVLAQGSPWVLFSIYTFRWQAVIWLIEFALVFLAYNVVVNARPRRRG